MRHEREEGGRGYFTINATLCRDIHVSIASGFLHTEVSLPRTGGAGKRTFLTRINESQPYACWCKHQLIGKFKILVVQNTDLLISILPEINIKLHVNVLRQVV